MIASTAVEAAVADAAVALDVDYDDPGQVTAERVEQFRDLVRAVRQRCGQTSDSTAEPKRRPYTTNWLANSNMPSNRSARPRGRQHPCGYRG